MYKTHKKAKGVTPLDKLFADIFLNGKSFGGTPLHLCSFELPNILKYIHLPWVQQSQNCYTFWCNGFTTVAPHLTN